MKRTVLVFGLISGIVISVLMAITTVFADRIGFDRAVIVGYTSMIMAFLLVFFGIRSYRENVGGGEISFAKAFQVGILITLISCVFYVVIWEIIYYNFLPDFADKYAAHIIEKARASGATEAQIAEQTQQMKEMKALLDNPLLSAAVIFISEPLPVGLVMTLISALLLRKRRKDSVGEMQSAVG
jgi:uncharacterized protein DUF4199